MQDFIITKSESKQIEGIRWKVFNWGTKLVVAIALKNGKRKTLFIMDIIDDEKHVDNP